MKILGLQPFLVHGFCMGITPNLDISCAKQIVQMIVDVVFGQILVPSPG